MNRLGIATLALVLLACRPPEPRELVTVEVTPEPIGAGPVRLDVDMPGGQLDVLGGGAEGISGTLRYDHPSMEPIFAVESTDDGATATLTAKWAPGIGPTTNLWTLNLPPSRPTDLDLNMGSGRLNVAPSGVTLRSMTARLNFGEVLCDLTEAVWDETLEVSIEIGNGPQARVVVPDDAGVRLRAIHSVGSVDAPAFEEKDDETWHGAGYGDRGRTLELVIRVGTGDIVVRTAAEEAAAAEEDESAADD
ncbi:MAG: hypothetical protein ACF8XB_00625 [Planctomycetota bacterium JB042]